MKKKISQIVAYTLLGVVVLGFVLCAIIKINFKPEINMPNLANGDKIQISLTGTSKVESSDENIVYDKFMNKFNNSFELTVLYSVFSGKINSELDIQKTSIKPSYNGYKVQFIYSETQTLKKDGKDVTSDAVNSNTPVTFNRVLFDVAEGKGLGEVVLYFYTEGDSLFYKVTTIANFDGLYSYISDIPMFAD